MPSVADYSIITETVHCRPEETIQFEIPKNINLRARCILGFNIIHQHPKPFSLVLILNGVMILETFIYEESNVNEMILPRIIYRHLLLPAGIIAAGRNTLYVEHQAGYAAMTLDGVVLWWQANP